MMPCVLSFPVRNRWTVWLLLAAAVAGAHRAHAAIDYTGASPANPLPFDEIRIEAAGWMSDMCWTLTGAEVRRDGDRIEMDVFLQDAWEPGDVCLPVITTYSASERLDPLPAGSYLVVVTERLTSLRDAWPDQRTFSLEVTEPVPPRIVSIGRVDPDGIDVRWAGDPRMAQTLESTDDLAAPEWIGRKTAFGGGSFADDIAAVDRRFYRVRQDPVASGRWIGSSGCGGWERDVKPAPNEECLDYDWDGEGRLSLTHRNACFNCCLAPVGAVEVDPSGRTIRIREREAAGMPCRCLCLYDIDYLVTDLDPGVYSVRIEAWDGEAWRLVMKMDLDLTAAGIGAYCEPRSGYPWD